MFKYALAMVIGTFISSLSQVILKKASEKKYGSVIREYLNFPVIFAYFIFFVSTLLSLLAYKGIPLSMGPVLEASSYLFVTIFGVTIFKEKLNLIKITALGLIIFGIVVYSVWG